MAVLYRKYRPQTFLQVVGQKSIIQTLQNQVKQGMLSHAYLFTGSRGVGKTSVARILAKAVNCLRQVTSDKLQVTSGDACGECSVCRAVEQGNFIDLIEIDAASNTGVDNVRDLIEHVKFAPSIGKYKVFIIDEVHMLSKGAFNALLKTLEEPPKHAIFILATTEIQKVPATIISRTQKFDFKALSLVEIKTHLAELCKKENLNYADEVLDLVAQNAQGSARDALSILDKISTLGSEASASDIRSVLGITDQVLLQELVNLIAQGKANEIPEYFDRLLETGTDFSIFNKDFLEFLRKLLVEKLTSQQIALDLSLNDLIFIIRLFLKSFKDLQSAPSPEIPLILAAIEGALKKSPKSFNQPTLVNQPTLTTIQTQTEDRTNRANMTDVKPIEVQTFFDGAAYEEVLVFWPRVVNSIKEQNGPLGSLLKVANLKSVENGRITLEVKYQFDKKTLEKNSPAIMDAIKNISGKNLGLVTQTASVETQSSPVAALTDALQIFGGELVE